MENHPEFFNDLKKFIHTVPKLPSSKKVFTSTPAIMISPDHTREEIISYLSSIRASSLVLRPSESASLIADLAFYAGRYMDSCDWQPFFKAAFERNPVSIDYFHDLDLPAIYTQLISWPNDSIYDGNRLALPDEVVNYQRGDGIEKAIALMNIAKSRHIDVACEQHEGSFSIMHGKAHYDFKTMKKLNVHLL